MHPLGSKRRSNSQKGMTLIEALVAVTVFTIVFLAALGLYQAANRAYMQTDAATIQQQNARYAMDRMSETIRDAGANYNPMGLTNLADEQVEGAWESALFVRGDFDNGRESSGPNLENSMFPMVTTGNDEIVGYVLRKSDDALNTTSITIKADLTTSGGRDASLNGTTITGEETSGQVKVAATNLAGQTNPPYQLVRVTFDNSGNPVYQTIADNVFRLSFTYLDNGNTAVISNGTNDGSADGDRANRAAIRKIGVRLITMADRADFGYTDPNTYTPAESASTKNRRKFTLQEQILAVNLGVTGSRQTRTPAVVIDAPTSLTVCTGHCNYFYLSWTPSATAGVTDYQIHITAPASASPAAAAIDTTAAAIGGTTLVYNMPDTISRAYTFQVAGSAGSNVGAFSVSSTPATAVNDAASVPAAPTTVTGGAGTGNTLNVSWSQVTQNGSAITNTRCTTVGTGAATFAPAAPWNTMAPDIKDYLVYRGTAATFAAATTSRIDNASMTGLANTANPTGQTFTDRLAAPCSAYYYRVAAEDLCAVVGTASAAAGPFSYTPATGINPGTPNPPAPNGSVTIVSGFFNVQLQWTAVVADSSGSPAATAHYKLFRERKNGAAGTYAADAVFDVGNALTYTDNTAAQTISGTTQFYRYYVQAIYDCSPARTANSDYYYLVCTPPSGNTVTVSAPANGDTISRPYEVAVTPRLTMGGTAWTGPATATIKNSAGTAVYSQTISGAPSSGQYTFPVWDASTAPDGVYTLTAVTSAGACQSIASSTFTLDTVVCNLAVATTPAPTYVGSGANTAKELDFSVDNPCSPIPVSVSKIRFTWSGVLATNYITSIDFGTTTVASGLTLLTGGNGVTITLSNASFTAGTTAVTVNFSAPMTADGTKNTTPGKFNSIILTTPGGSDEIITGTPIP